MKLSVVVGTLNRLEQLKDCVESILKETAAPVKVYVTDAGSSDGTIEYLQSISSEKVVPVLVGKKLGQARAYNDVFRIVDTPYVCWLSDDNAVVNNGLDTALEILERDSSIGMVALKVRDMQGPFVEAPYIGGISSIGILNVNQGMLPTAVLKAVGGFGEEFRDYGIDPDLTAKVLFRGYRIVYTKKICLHHYRNWAVDTSSEDYRILQEKQKRYLRLYESKYSGHLNQKRKSGDCRLGISKKTKGLVRAVLPESIYEKKIRNREVVRDLYNIVNARFINIFDPILNIGKKYYLVQAVPGTKRVSEDP